MNRQEFFGNLPEETTEEEITHISHAYWFAKNVHREQKRDCGERYFEHCRRVATTLLDLGDATSETIVIALLHDCIEDGFIPDGIIRNLFGNDVERAIATLSKVWPVFGNDGCITEKVRKTDEAYFGAISEAPESIRRIKLADRLDNLSTMQDVWTKKRQQKYILETRTYLLPIAWATNEKLAKRLEEICRSFSE